MRVFADGLELVGQSPGSFTRGQTLKAGDSLNYQKWVEASEEDVRKTFAIITDWTGWGEKSNWNEHTRIRVIPHGAAPSLADLQGGMENGKSPVFVWPGVPVMVAFGYQMAPKNEYDEPRMGRLVFKAKFNQTTTGTSDEVTFWVDPEAA